MSAISDTLTTNICKRIAVTESINKCNFDSLVKVVSKLEHRDTFSVHAFWFKGVVTIAVAILVIALIVLFLDIYLKSGRKLKFSAVCQELWTNRKTGLHFLLEVLLLLSLLSIIFILFIHKPGFVSLFAIAGLIIGAAGMYFARRADFSSSVTQNQTTKSLASLKNFSDDLGEFVEKLKFTLENLVLNGESFTIKFLSVIPAFGKVGLDAIRLDGKNLNLDTPPYVKKKNIQSDYQTWDEFILHFLSEYNGSKTGKVRAVLKLITHEAYARQDWIKNIVTSSQIMKLQDSRLNRLVNELDKDQERFLFGLEHTKGIDRDQVFVKAWPGLKTKEGELVQLEDPMPFQFVIIKKRLESLNDPPKSYANDKDILLFLFSGDYIYKNVTAAIRTELIDRSGSSMSVFVKFTKGYYSDVPDQTKFFNILFDELWYKAKLLKMPTAKP
jgi:hypothetical protein